MTEPADLSLRCRCGNVTGTLRLPRPAAGNRVVCHCRSCQRFARDLGAAADILDAHGGSDLLQCRPSSFEVTSGIDQLACLRLSEKGPLRWYARCCSTPIANTAGSAQLPILSLLVQNLARHGDTARVEAALGPARGRSFLTHATGEPPLPDGHPRFPPSLMLRFIGSALLWRLRGEHRRHPFFSPDTLAPIAQPVERV